MITLIPNSLLAYLLKRDDETTDFAEPVDFVLSTESLTEVVPDDGDISKCYVITTSGIYKLNMSVHDLYSRLHKSISNLSCIGGN